VKGVEFTEHQIRAALLRAKMCEAMTGARKLTKEEIANYYGEGAACPKGIWPFLQSEGLIAFVPMRLTPIGRAWLDAHPKPQT
jgi:hypothetical protein